VLLTPIAGSRGGGQVVGGTLELASLGVGSTAAKVDAPVPAKISFTASCFTEARNPEPRDLELGELVGEVSLSEPDFVPELVVSVADSQALLEPPDGEPEVGRPRVLRLALKAPTVVMPPDGPSFVQLTIPAGFLDGARHLELRATLEVNGNVEGDASVNDVLDVPLLPQPLFKLAIVDEMREPLGDVPVDFSSGDEIISAISDDSGPLIFDDLGFADSTAQITDNEGLKAELKQRWSKIRPGPVLKEDPDAGVEARFVGTSLDPISFDEAPLKTLAIVPRVTLVRLVGLLFDTDKSFLLPSALSDMADLHEVSDEHPDSELLVVGHTDTSADPATNDPLSLERAESVIAFLRQDIDTWLKRYDSKIAAKHRWGSNEDQQMLLSLPGMLQRPSGEDPVSFFRRTRAVQEQGAVGPETRRTLIEEYMSQPEPILPDDTPLTAHGCGEFFPLDAAGDDVDPNPKNPERDPIDRRVELFFFDREFGIQPKPPGKNSKKSSKEYPEWRRRATLSRHVDLRLSDRVLRVRMQANDQDLPNEDFSIDVDGRRLAAGQTDANALIVQRLPVGAKLVEIRIPRLDLHRSIALTPAEEFPSVSTLVGVQTRLAQLGFLPEEPNGKLDQLTRDALRSFRSNQGLGNDSTLDDATRNALVKAYGS
jgi:outer membrane protein OmpA-like peptidoglycan-associated protein